MIQDNSIWIRNSVEDVQKTLVEGAALTIFIVFLFLNSWRSTIITGLTLPVAVISSFLAFNAFGFTLNLMTLMALSLVIGILIDDAIVVRENIVRHVEKGEDHFEAARKGTSEIGFAVLATSLSIVSVFIPVAFMGGIVGKFFFEFGIVIAFAVLVSLFVSFTLDPMLSSRWYDPQAEGATPTGFVGKLLKRFNDGFAHIGERYRGVIAWALDHRPLVLAIAVASFLAALAFPMLGIVGGQFMPKSDEEQTLVAFETPVGSSLDYTTSKGLELVRYLEARSEVKYTYLTIGGAAQNNAVNRGQVFVQMTKRRERALTQQAFETDIRRDLPRFQGAEARVLLSGPVGGAQAPIVINIRDPTSPCSSASPTGAGGDPGCARVGGAAVVAGGPQARVAGGRQPRPRRRGRPLGRPDRRGPAPGALGREGRRLGGPERSLLRRPRADGPRVPHLGGRPRARAGGLGAHRPAHRQPVMVPLGQVATFRRGGAPDQIDRQNLERIATLEGNYQGRPLTDVVGDAQARLATLSCRPATASTSAASRRTSSRPWATWSSR